MKLKKDILVFIDWYLPGYKAGGPIRSCANLVSHLCDSYNFWIVTRDTDYCETVPYPTIRSNEWITLSNGSRVFYISKNNLSSATINKIIKAKEFDAYYINGVFSFYFSILPLFYLRKFSNKLVLIAARGMLAASALTIKKTKKKLFMSVANILNLFDNVIFHATNSREAEDIITALGNKVSIRIAPNLAEAKASYSFNEKEKKLDQPLRIINVARIAPEKNLLYALKILAEVKTPVLFDVYGPIYSQSYWDECLSYVAKLPSTINFNYKGALPSEDVEEILKQYHFFFMPTLGENFGHIILQALLASCPLIISDQTPWRNLENENVGWDIALNAPLSFVKAIERAAQLSPSEFNQMAEAAYRKALKMVNDKGSVEQNHKLFLDY